MRIERRKILNCRKIICCVIRINKSKSAFLFRFLNIRVILIILKYVFTGIKKKTYDN